MITRLTAEFHAGLPKGHSHRFSSCLWITDDNPAHSSISCRFTERTQTGWRNDGQSGYVWLFATDKISLFLFRKTRSSSVAREVFGDKPLPGTLVVDRYNVYNKAPCQIQYCYAHLLREVEEMGKEFSEVDEVKTFVGALAPLLATAMHLRCLPITGAQFYEQAEKVKSQIMEIVHASAQHLAIRRIQEIFHDSEGRLYHWAKDRRVPADNNLAERDLPPPSLPVKSASVLNPIQEPRPEVF